MKNLSYIFTFILTLAVLSGCRTPESIYFQDIQSGDYQPIEKALKSNIDPNLRDAEGKTALIWLACLKDKTWQMGKFIEKGADVNIQDNNGWTPLIHAAYNSCEKNVKYLLKHGADVNIKTKDGQNALSLAFNSPDFRSIWISEKGMPMIYEELINAGIDTSVQNREGNPALIVTAGKNWFKAVELLLKKGDDVNCRNAQGMTPLIAAVIGDRLKAVKILIENSASINLKSNEGGNALFYGRILGHKKLCQHLEKHGAKIPTNLKPEYAAIYAASIGDVKRVKELLAEGVDIESRTDAGVTMLISATLNQDEKMLRFLLKHGADPNAAYSEYKITALLMACIKNDLKLTRILLDNKADPNLA